MPNRWFRLPVVLFAGWCAATGAAPGAVTAARADIPNDRAVISAQAFGQFPDGAPVAIEPRDDSDTNLHLRDLMAARLRVHQHAFMVGAPLRLRFSAEPVSSAGPRPGASTGDSVVASDRQSFTPNNLGYSEADRFFGGPTERDPTAVQNSYRVRATLETRTGQVLWRGQATGTLNDRNEARLAAALAEALADAVGQTVDSRFAAVPSGPVQSMRPTALGNLYLPLPALPELAERR